MKLTLDELNILSEDQARQAFMQCCTALRWVEQMAASRPYVSVEACQDRAAQVWADMEEVDYLEAFEGHPKIGDINSLRMKYASTKKLAAGEQSSVNDADDTTIQGLADGNLQYEAQNGFIFIVCATGKSAGEMLEILKGRLSNERAEELRIAANEQSKITAIRIKKLLSES